MTTDYDLLIVGGGMVGASLACALLPVAQTLNLKVAVVETEAPPGPGEPVFRAASSVRNF